MSLRMLLVATDFPVRTGPGSLRNFQIYEHFRSQGWRIKVLSRSANENNQLPDSNIHYVCVKDSVERFSIRGKYLGVIEIPDRWWTWIIPAINKGVELIKSDKPDFIFASFPSYSSLIVGVYLSKKFDIKLVSDFRDPFRYQYDPKNVPCHFLYRWIEKYALNQTTILSATTKECLSFYEPCLNKSKDRKPLLVPNGVDDSVVSLIDGVKKVGKPKLFTMLHSGNLYKIGRDPSLMLRVLSKLKLEALISASNFTLVFRGTSPWPELTELINELKIEDLVSFREPVDFEESISEIQSADLNIIIQNEMFSMQIPSKLYNLMALGTNVIAVTNKEGALASELSRYMDEKAVVENENELKERLTEILLNRKKYRPENRSSIPTRKQMNTFFSQQLVKEYYDE